VRRRVLGGGIGAGSKQKNCAHFEESMKLGMDKL